MSQKGTGSFEQAILNSSFNPDTGLLQVELMGTDGQGSRTQVSDTVAMKVTEDGLVTYIAIAKPSSLQSEAVWQAKKIDETTGVVVTWAGGGSFNQVATDLPSLSYS